MNARVAWMRDTRDHLLQLRNDAVTRGMKDLVEIYSRSSLRISQDIVAATAEDIVKQIRPTEETDQ